jgi:hypothetical protein
LPKGDTEASGAIDEATREDSITMLLHQVDELWYLEIVPVIIMDQGNSKSGDTLVSQFNGKNYITLFLNI